MRFFHYRPFALFCYLFVSAANAQVPSLLSYQGRVAVGTVNFDGSGQFKFALVNANGSTSYWSNDGSSAAGSEPTAAVTLNVNKGLYGVLLGDTTLTNMSVIPASVFTNTDVRLRVWFNDGTNGAQLLAPDQRIASVGYAMMAGSVPDGSITTAKLASGAIGSTQLASGITLGGTTTGTFSGNLSGNATTATSAATATTSGSFTGTMAGDVTGTQGATVVATVGGSTATNVGAAVLAANAATSSNTASTLVKRDASGNFTAGTLTMAGGFNLAATSSSTVGVLSQGGTRLLHTFGTANFFAGSGAGNFAMTGSGRNVSVGNNTLQSNTTGAFNTAVGTDVMKVNSTGYANTGIGSGALYFNTTGFNNTATGGSSLNANTIGTGNTATGNGSMIVNTTAGNNVAIGAYTLFSQSYSNGGTSWSSNNVAVGYQALNNNQPVSTDTGINNTAVGVSALGANITGANNIAIGKNAGNLLTTGNNNICIGHQGIAGESNAIRIGDGSSQTTAYITGISGATSSGGVAVFVNSSGQLGTITSSRRFKDDIQSMDHSSEAILSLRPVIFRYKPEIDAKGIPQWGLIAEEVADVNPDLVVRDDKGVIQTVRYEQVNAMLLNEFLKDHRRADAKDVEIAELKRRLAELEAKDKAREERLAKLEQFIPAESKNQVKTAANIKAD